VRSHIDWREEQVSARTLAPKWGRHRTVARKDTRPRKEVNCEISHRSKREMSASEDTGPRKGWIIRSHISWRGEQNV